MQIHTIEPFQAVRDLDYVTFPRQQAAGEGMPQPGRIRKLRRQDETLPHIVLDYLAENRYTVVVW
jgi:hypothetical protein